MVKCSFCGKDEHMHIGLHLIRNTGHVDYFCSSKCKKNSIKLKRDKKKLKWTTAFYETRDKAKALVIKNAEKAVVAKHERAEAEKVRVAKVAKKAVTKAAKKEPKKE